MITATQFRQCVACHKAIKFGDKCERVPVGYNGAETLAHVECTEAYLARRAARIEKRGGKAGAYHKSDGRVIRGTNSC